MKLRDLLPYGVYNRYFKEESQKAAVIDIPFRTGKTIKPNFKSMTDYYFSDPDVKGAIDELGESSVGHGFHLTADDSNVLTDAEDWMEELKIDQKNQSWARELWLTGNTMSEAIDPRKLETIVRIPISSIDKIDATKFGVIEKVHQTLGTTRQWVTYDRVIHWKWNDLDGDVLGHGLVECLLKDGLGYYLKDANDQLIQVKRPSHQQVLEETEDNMRKILRKYVPRYVFNFKGFAEDEVNVSTIRTLRPEDDVALTTPNKDKQEIEITTLSADPRSRLHPFIEYFRNARYTALQTPTLKLFLEAGFTEASAKTAVQVLTRKMGAFQRFHKRNLEHDVLKPYIMQQNKLKGPSGEKTYKKYNLRLNWGQIEKPQLEMNDILRLAEISARYRIPYISPYEVRKTLQDQGFSIDENEYDKYVQELEQEKKVREQRQQQFEQNKFGEKENADA